MSEPPRNSARCTVLDGAVLDHALGLFTIPGRGEEAVAFIAGLADAIAVIVCPVLPDHLPRFAQRLTIGVIEVFVADIGVVFLDQPVGPGDAG